MGKTWEERETKADEGAHSLHLSLCLSNSTDVDRIPPGLSAYVNNEGRIKYDRPARVTSICNLDIFYFPFDQQNCTFTFTSFLYTGETGSGSSLRSRGRYLSGVGIIRESFGSEFLNCGGPLTFFFKYQ